MEELVRRLIRERRRNAVGGARPSEVFLRYFGPERGVELPEPSRHGYRPFGFEGEDEDESEA